jgi:hypothetical protein
MSYNERKQRGLAFESEVANYLERTGYEVTRCGVEKHETNFVDCIRYDQQPLAKFVKNHPDGYAINEAGIMFAWDAKVGLHISRDAWEAYQHVAKIGALFLFFKTGLQVLSGEIKSIELEHGDETTAGFGSTAHPRDRDGWICPRLGQHWNGSGSGSPYRKVRTSTIDPVENFPHTPCQIES